MTAIRISADVTKLPAIVSRRFLLVKIIYDVITWVSALGTLQNIFGISLSSVPWSIRPLTTHDVFIFKVRFLAASHMVRGDVSPVFSITWLRKRSLCPPLAFFPWTLPARMRSSSSPFRMMWPVKRVCLSLMVLRSWRSCPIR